MESSVPIISIVMAWNMMRIGVASLKLKYRFIKEGVILILLLKKKLRRSVEPKAEN